MRSRTPTLVDLMKPTRLRAGLLAGLLIALIGIRPTDLPADGLRVELVPGSNQVTVVVHNTSATNDYQIRRKQDLAATAWTLERQVPGLDGQIATPLPTNGAPTAFFSAQEAPSATNSGLTLHLTSALVNYTVGAPPLF